MSELNGNLYDELFLTAKTLLKYGSDMEDLEKHLFQKTKDLILISKIIKEAKKEHYATLRKEGLAKIAIGTGLILLGFCITCFNFHANKSIELAMYGFTSAGLFFVFWGLFKIIG